VEDYDRLERSDRAPKRVVDHSATWAKLEPVGSLNGQTEERLRSFCASKRITLEALEALGSRVALRRGGRVELAFAGENGQGAVTAIKYRPIGGSSHDSSAEAPSTWLRPIIVGKRDSLDWLVAEGETDAARLYDLVGDVAAIMVLPAGAKTFKREWASLIPRGSTVGLAHDADEQGDAGAEKAAKLIGGRTIRLRPPVEGGDWCDWPGGREELLELFETAAQTSEARWQTLSEIVAKAIVFVWKPFLQASAFHMLVGIKNAGKGTFLAHLAARFTLGEFGERRRVLWIALGEDSYAIDVRPRIEAAGGSVSLVDVWVAPKFRLPDDVAEIERRALELGDVGLIIIDPIGGGMAAGKSTNFDADVREAIAPLNTLADVSEAIVIGVRHLSIKPERRAGGALAALLGSSDWSGVPRAVLSLIHDDVDPQVRHLFVSTSNRMLSGSGLMLRVEGHSLPGLDGEEVTRARIIGESSKDPDELLVVKTRQKTSKSDAARRLILELLYATARRTMESDTLDAEVAKRTGLAARTVRDIRTDMRKEGLVRPTPEKDSEGEIQRWLVTLTGAGEAAALTTTTSDVPTHNLSQSGVDTPDWDLSVSRHWESPVLDEEPKTPDFVTPPEASPPAANGYIPTPEQLAALDALFAETEGERG